MNEVREWIEMIISLSRDQAEYGEFHRKVQEQLFIFAIEIGRRKRLTPAERAYYEKTLATAEVLLGITERSISNLAERIPYDRIMDDCVVDWIGHEPALKRLLERLTVWNPGYSAASGCMTMDAPNSFPFVAWRRT
jgi:hypothetical protein